MTQAGMDRPCIHVSLLPNADPTLYRWIEIGAEEEGVPTRQTFGEAEDVVALAYQAAQSSRFQIGVAISDQVVILHEQHMPAGQPVLRFRFENNAPYLCRVMGANAARMVVHRPLHVDPDFPPASVKSVASKPVEQLPAGERFASNTEVDPVYLARIIAMVVRKLQERGI